MQGVATTAVTGAAAAMANAAMSTLITRDPLRHLQPGQSGRGLERDGQ